MISKEYLKQILTDQRERIEKQNQKDWIKRNKLKDIKRFIKPDQNIIITGVRRCGKSVFLSQIMHKFFDNYYYVNFEDERLSEFNLKDFSLLYETCIELFGKSKTFFLDEIQNIKGWEKWVRRMYDDNFKFFITGSNATLLSRELATSLTGRHLKFTIFPFSFREFLRFKGMDINEKDIYSTENRALIKKHFSSYLKNGGFPEFVKFSEIEILQEYFNDIIQRDILQRYNVENLSQLKTLAKHLMTNTGKLTSYNQLKKLIDAKSNNTVKKYFSYLENAYLVFKVPLFSYSLTKQTKSPFKVYGIDIGLRNAVSFKFSGDLGRDFETIVALELKRRGEDIYYWKSKKKREVDFVLKEDKNVEQLIQVCYDVSEDSTKKRELDGLLKASKKLNCKNLLVITNEYEETEKVGNRKVEFVPLWKWLLKY